MAKNPEIVAAIDKTLAQYQAETADIDRQLQGVADLALQDWLLMEACKDYDTIELSDEVVGKSKRKQWKALRDRKRNLEKMIVALQDLRQTAAAAEGEKLRKKFEQEMEKYQ